METFRRLADWYRKTFSDPEETLPVPTGEGASPMPARPARPLTALVCTPREYRDARYAAQSLKEGKVVLVRLSAVDAETAQRLIDFLSGAVYLLHGAMQLYGGEVLLCTPDTVRVERDTFRFRFGEEPVFKIKNEQ